MSFYKCQWWYRTIDTIKFELSVIGWCTCIRSHLPIWIVQLHLQKMNFIMTTFVIDFFFMNNKTYHTLFTSSSWLMRYNIHGSWHFLVDLKYMYMQITCFQWREKFVIICRLNWKSRLNTTFMFAVINIGILQLKFTYVYLTSWHAFHDIWNGKYFLSLPFCITFIYVLYRWT